MNERKRTSLFAAVETLRPAMVETLSRLVEIPAVSPLDGGAGEGEKAAWLERHIASLDLGETRRYDAPDEKAPDGIRPNLVLSIPGEESEAGRLVLVSHVDVVPEGNRDLWTADPFRAVVRDGHLYGRGSNDNGQELVASLYAALALKKMALRPRRDLLLCFVADEERGSAKGICHLLEEGLFRPEDLVVVPDGGNEKGDFVEVAEKGILWLQFRVRGRQTHASRPDLGLNACRVANAFAVELDEALHRAFPALDDLFVPPFSTFEPTKRLANVANVNTVPGEEVLCFDCRVVPSVPLDDVLAVVRSVIGFHEERSGATIELTLLERGDAAEPTSTASPVVRALVESLGQVYGFDPVVGGVGGGTCAAYFRQAGIPAVVWAQEAECAHMPDEYAVIDHLVAEAKVFALLMMEA